MQFFQLPYLSQFGTGCQLNSIIKYSCYGVQQYSAKNRYFPYFVGQVKTPHQFICQLTLAVSWNFEFFTSSSGLLLRDTEKMQALALRRTYHQSSITLTCQSVQPKCLAQMRLHSDIVAVVRFQRLFIVKDSISVLKC